MCSTRIKQCDILVSVYSTRTMQYDILVSVYSIRTMQYGAHIFELTFLSSCLFAAMLHAQEEKTLRAGEKKTFAKVSIQGPDSKTLPKP